MYSKGGNSLYESIQPIFDSVNLSKIKLDNQKKEISGTIKIGFSHSMAMSFIPTVLKNFKRKYPKINPVIKLANSAKLVELISNREIDLGIGIDDASFFKLESKSIKKGKFILASTKSEINLDNETFLIGDKGDKVVKFKHFYQKNRLENQIIEVESWEVITRFIQSNMGIGLIPDYIIESVLGTKLYPVDIGLKLPQYELKCFYRQEQYLTRNSRLFLDQFN